MATTDDPAAKLTLLERRRIEAAVLVPVIRALQAEFGVEAVNRVVGNAIREIARAQGAAERERAASSGIEGVAERTRSGVLREGSLIADIVEQTPERFGFNVTRCKFKEMYEEMCAGDLGFLLSCNRDYAFFEGLAPDLAFERTQTRMEGADFCDFRYSATKSAANPG
ncbi:MAG: L-2-amino-thiazoline-4-carboxylic acid hydrolase [Hyphomicrobiales bacterium]